jgi:Gamma-glutamyltranspeptidase
VGSTTTSIRHFGAGLHSLYGFLVRALRPTNTRALAREKRSKIRPAARSCCVTPPDRAFRRRIWFGGAPCHVSPLGVTKPFVAGIGGGGYFVHYDARTGRVATIDGRETAPASATQNVFIDPDELTDFDFVADEYDRTGSESAGRRQAPALEHVADDRPPSRPAVPGHRRGGRRDDHHDRARHPRQPDRSRHDAAAGVRFPR